jgi:hypothetical protein
MSKWFSKSTEFNIQLTDPPLYNKYSPVNPNVNGIVTIKFLEQLKKVSNIKCGLVGYADIMYYASDLQYGGFQTTGIRRTLITQRIEFFNTYDDLPLECENYNNSNFKNDERRNGNAYLFNEDEKLECQFNFEFPNIVFLPSSCKNFGNLDAAITINYEIYVDIYKYGKILTTKTKKYSSYKFPIFYQAGMDPIIAKHVTTLNYKKSEIFKDKVKKFYFDENTKALIPSSLNRSHSKTKFIRQLWNNNYKPEFYNTITKTLPITLDFSVRSSFDMNEPFSSQIALSLLSDLKEIGIQSNQTKDFVFNGQSTNLGFIQIESLTVETVNKINLQCHQYLMCEYTKDIILKINFKGLTFDIKDFEFSKLDDAYKNEVPIDTLCKCADVDINQSLMDILEDKTIMSAGFVPDWFENDVKLIFTWKLSDGISQKLKMEFSTSATPDFLLGISNIEDDDKDFIPPPTYEMSKDDEQITN